MQKGRGQLAVLVAVVILIILFMIFQFLYFQIAITQVKTDLVATQKRVEEISVKKEPDNLPALVDQLKAKFANYDKDMKTVVEAIKNLQNAVYKK